jgi:hypothetical protein
MNCPYPTLCLSVFTLPSWFGLLVATEGVPSPRRHRDRTGRRSNILPLHPSCDGDHLHLSWQFLKAIVPRGEATFLRSARPTAQVPSRRPNVCPSFVSCDPSRRARNDEKIQSFVRRSTRSKGASWPTSDSLRHGLLPCDRRGTQSNCLARTLPGLISLLLRSKPLSITGTPASLGIGPSGWTLDATSHCVTLFENSGN